MPTLAVGMLEENCDMPTASVGMAPGGWKKLLRLGSRQPEMIKGPLRFVAYPRILILQ
jgi:hypothetical protein